MAFIDYFNALNIFYIEDIGIIYKAYKQAFFKYYFNYGGNVER
jgi:hypothetical protein